MAFTCAVDEPIDGDAGDQELPVEVRNARQDASADESADRVRGHLENRRDLGHRVHDRPGLGEPRQVRL
jgi:hypothetical protein